jgi:DNA-binding MarR family transcriptional regulator
MEGLCDISTNLLTERLKSLEQHGLIRRRVLPPPAASMVYELTSLGMGLQATLLEMGKWGSQFLPPMTESTPLLHLGSYALTPMTFFRAAEAAGLDERYALYIDREMLHFHIRDGEITVRQGEGRRANVKLHASMEMYMGLLAGALSLDEALASKQICVEGDLEALRRFFKLCGLPSGLVSEASSPGAVEEIIEETAA